MYLLKVFHGLAWIYLPFYCYNIIYKISSILNYTPIEYLIPETKISAERTTNDDIKTKLLKALQDILKENNSWFTKINLNLKSKFMHIYSWKKIIQCKFSLKWNTTPEEYLTLFLCDIHRTFHYNFLCLLTTEKIFRYTEAWRKQDYERAKGRSPETIGIWLRSSRSGPGLRHLRHKRVYAVRICSHSSNKSRHNKQAL